MSRNEWLAHLMMHGVNTKTQLLEHRPGCAVCAARHKTWKANRARQAKGQAYADLGMVKARGAMGRTYYE